MATSGGQPDNHNSGKNKPWADALRKALAVTDPIKRRKKLFLTAEALVDKALEGDVSALKEIGDRMDGKARQSIDAEVTGTLTINVIKDFGD